MINRVTVHEAAAAISENPNKNHFIDVREEDEIQVVAAEGARIFPMSQLNPQTFEDTSRIPKSNSVYIICRSGGRSMRVATALEAQGYQHIFNVEGGIIAWAEANLPTKRGS